MEHPTFYRTTPIDGLSIFYREAGPKDVPKAELHVLDAGHFALDTAADQIALLIQGFMVDSHKLESSRKLSVGDGNARDWRIRTITSKALPGWFRPQAR